MTLRVLPGALPWAVAVVLTAAVALAAAGCDSPPGETDGASGPSDGAGGAGAAPVAVAGARREEGVPLAAIVAPAAESELPERIAAVAGGPAVELSGTLAPAGIARFVFSAEAGRRVTLAVSSVDDAVLPSVAGSDGTGLTYAASGLPSWSGEVPATQDYFVTLVNAGASDRAFGLSLAVLSDGERLAPSGAGRTTEMFADGADVAFHAVDPAAGEHVFTFQARPGEWLHAALGPAAETGPVLTVRGPGGMVAESAPTGAWRGPLPRSGAYTLTVAGGGRTPSVLAARRLVPAVAAAVPRPADDGSGAWLVEGSVQLAPGRHGGASWRLPPGWDGPLRMVVAPATPDTEALVTVWSAADGSLALFDQVPAGHAIDVAAVAPDAVLTLLVAGGIQGRAVRYGVRLERP